LSPPQKSPECRPAAAGQPPAAHPLARTRSGRRALKNPGRLGRGPRGQGTHGPGAAAGHESHVS